MSIRTLAMDTRFSHDDASIRSSEAGTAGTKYLVEFPESPHEANANFVRQVLVGYVTNYSPKRKEVSIDMLRTDLKLVHEWWHNVPRRSQKDNVASRVIGLSGSESETLHIRSGSNLISSVNFTACGSRFHEAVRRSAWWGGAPLNL